MAKGPDFHKMGKGGADMDRERINLCGQLAEVDQAMGFILAIIAGPPSAVFSADYGIAGAADWCVGLYIPADEEIGCCKESSADSQSSIESIE